MCRYGAPGGPSSTDVLCARSVRAGQAQIGSYVRVEHRRGDGARSACDSRLCVRYGEQLPVAGHALEFIGATVRELDTRPGDEIGDGARHEDVTAISDRGDSGADVDRDPPISWPRSSISPVWRPTRTSTPSDRNLSRNSQPQETARAGPSNVATTPSPVKSTSFPR